MTILVHDFLSMTSQHTLKARISKRVRSCILHTHIHQHTKMSHVSTLTYTYTRAFQCVTHTKTGIEFRRIMWHDSFIRDMTHSCVTRRISKRHHLSTTKSKIQSTNPDLTNVYFCEYVNRKKCQAKTKRRTKRDFTPFFFYEYVVDYPQLLSHSTRMNEFWYVSDGTHVNESWHTYEWVMARELHIWMSHESYGCIMAHKWMSAGTNKNSHDTCNESWHTYECVTEHI